MKGLTITSTNIQYYLTRCLFTVVDGTFDVTIVMASATVIATATPYPFSSFFGTFDTHISFLVLFAVVITGPALLFWPFLLLPP